MTENSTVITANQIRAGRALLNWPQKVLAARSGISLNSLNGIERDFGNPRRETLATIKTTLEAAGIEFLESDGVRKRSERMKMETIEGEDVYLKLQHRILEELGDRKKEREVLSCGYDQQCLNKIGAVDLSKQHHLNESFKQKGITQRVLVHASDVTFLCDSNIYR